MIKRGVFFKSNLSLQIKSFWSRLKWKHLGLYFWRKVSFNIIVIQCYLRFWHSLKVGITERIVPAKIFSKQFLYFSTSRKLGGQKNWYWKAAKNTRFHFYHFLEHIYKLVFRLFRKFIFLKKFYWYERVVPVTSEGGQFVRRKEPIYQNSSRVFKKARFFLFKKTSEEYVKFD